jgi:hypothetical protein
VCTADEWFCVNRSSGATRVRERPGMGCIYVWQHECFGRLKSLLSVELYLTELGWLGDEEL